MSSNVADSREHAFVREFIPLHVGLLGQYPKEGSIAKGNYLERQGDPADEIYLIRSEEVASGNLSASRRRLQRLLCGGPSSRTAKADLCEPLSAAW